MNGRTRSGARAPERPGFGQLREDARRLVGEAPDGLDSLALAQALFGAAAGERWVPLLPTVLDGDGRLRCEAGRWHLTTRPPASRHARAVASAATAPPLQSPPDQAVGTDDLTCDVRAPILALALTTTGADPRRHRIARIGIVRREKGEITARFDLEIDGEWRTPGRSWDGVDDSVADDALTFEDVLPALHELIDGRVVYAYGARRAAAFLDAERRRAGLSDLNVRLLELDDRIREILPDRRKPGLMAAADELGIPAATRESAIAEADLVARVLERLRERQAASPGRAAIVVSPHDESEQMPLPFTHAWLAGVSEGPGVYVVEDAAGTTLYVGKAVALRRRLAAYVSKPLSLHRRFEALGVRAATVRTIEVASDLEGSLLEGRLIRQYRPPFNVARETRDPAAIVRAAPDDPTPRVHLVAAVRKDGARYFGPFESVNVARRAVSMAREVYPAAFERRRGDVAVRRQAVLAVCQLLAGQQQPALASLRQAMVAAAEAGDRAALHRLRAALRDVQECEMRPSVLVGVAGAWRLLALERLDQSPAGRLHLIQDGRLIASADTVRSALPGEPGHLTTLVKQAFGSRLQATLSDDWSPADTSILLRWLVQARQRLDVARLPNLPTFME